MLGQEGQAGEQETEDRGQRTEGRGQRTEGRGRKTAGEDDTFIDDLGRDSGILRFTKRVNA